MPGLPAGRQAGTPASREADSGPDIAAPGGAGGDSPKYSPPGRPATRLRFRRPCPRVAPPRSASEDRSGPELVLTSHTENPAPAGAARATADLPASKPATSPDALKGVPLPPLGQAVGTAAAAAQAPPASLLGGTQP